MKSSDALQQKFAAILGHVRKIEIIYLEWNTAVWKHSPSCLRSRAGSGGGLNGFWTLLSFYINNTLYLVKGSIIDTIAAQEMNWLVTAGNVFVMMAILLDRQLQSVANYLILSLALADLLVAVLVMPLGAVYEVSEVAYTEQWQPCVELTVHTPLHCTIVHITHYYVE